MVVVCWFVGVVVGCGVRCLMCGLLFVKYCRCCQLFAVLYVVVGDVFVLLSLIYVVCRLLFAARCELFIVC